MRAVETKFDNNAVGSYAFQFIVLYGSHGILKTYIKDHLPYTIVTTKW
jgi:hypothetical protein